MHNSADIVICGAGIAGIAAAHALAVRQGIRNVVLVDERPPLSLTSDKSTECYRNWWPGPGDAMVALMNRSVDMLEELADGSDNRFLLNRRGYLYASAAPERIDTMRAAAAEAEALGAGPTRIHSGDDNGTYTPTSAHGYKGQPAGADLILDKNLIRTQFPYLADDTLALVHARRCGWLSAQQLGMLMLEQARAHGVTLLPGRVTAVDAEGGRVRGVRMETGGATHTIATDTFVSAAGPFQAEICRMLGVELPVYSELHIKASINDHLGVVPRDAPMLIWTDPIQLAWTDEEREMLADTDEAWLLDALPAGVHARPEGGPGSTALLMLWAYHSRPVPERFPITIDDSFLEVALRGMSRMVPGLAAYLERTPKPYLDGGYYTRTRENRPLIGPLPVPGAYLVGALSGFGVMAACAAGELLAAHITGGALPHYAPAFALDRYDDPHYQALLERWGDEGQL